MVSENKGLMIKRFIIVAAGLIILFGAIFGVKYLQMKRMAAQMAQPQPPATIAATTVKREIWRPTLKAVGSLKAVNGTEVTTEAAGKVSAISFDSGQHVSAGDILLKLDATVDEATLQGLKADRRLAAIQLKRSKELLNREATSRSQYDEARANYAAADARVSEQQEKIAQKVIRAPFSGLLGIRQVDLGAYLSPGQTIVALQALNPIYVDYALPENDFRNLSEGQQVEVQLDAYPGEAFRGRISALDSRINQATRTIHVRATIPNPDGRLRPGMFAQVRTLESNVQHVLTVPRTAISYNTYGDYAYVLVRGENGTLIAKRRQVDTGAVQQERVVVSKGLQAGDQVVSAGLEKLRDGQPVQVDNSVRLNEKVSNE